VSDNESLEKCQLPAFVLNHIIAAINEVSSITSNYDMSQADKQDTKRMKYQVEEK
jgi:hypothetical protein